MKERKINMKKLLKKINWGYILYLVRKLISKIGYVAFGCFFTVGLEISGFNDKYILGGMAISLLLGIITTIDNPDPTEKNKRVF